MGLLSDVWTSMCKFIKSCWKAFCRALEAIVDFYIGYVNFILDLLSIGFNAIAKGIKKVFVLIFHRDEILKKKATEFINKGNITQVPVFKNLQNPDQLKCENVRMAVTYDVSNGSVDDYKIYNANESDDYTFKEVENKLKYENIVELT